MEWYKEYYSLMQSEKERKPTFSSVLRHLYSVLRRYEPSFSSKLVATIDVNLPVWDVFVLKNIDIKVPSYTSTHKLEQAEATYQEIQKWYERYMKSEEGIMILRTFRDIVPEHDRISDIKKIDFVLWQTRSQIVTLNPLLAKPKEQIGFHVE